MKESKFQTQEPVNTTPSEKEGVQHKNTATFTLVLTQSHLEKHDKLYAIQCLHALCQSKLINPSSALSFVCYTDAAFSGLAYRPP